MSRNGWVAGRWGSIGHGAGRSESESEATLSDGGEWRHGWGEVKWLIKGGGGGMQGREVVEWAKYRPTPPALPVAGPSRGCLCGSTAPPGTGPAATALETLTRGSTRQLGYAQPTRHFQLRIFARNLEPPEGDRRALSYCQANRVPGLCKPFALGRHGPRMTTGFLGPSQPLPVIWHASPGSMLSLTNPRDHRAGWPVPEESAGFHIHCRRG